MKSIARQRRHDRVRSQIAGSAERPRLVIFRGNKTISAQLVDDAAGKVLLTVSQRKASLASASVVGTDLAKQAKTKKVSTVVFDRAGYRYHGIVKAVAEAARDGGLKI